MTTPKFSFNSPPKAVSRPPQPAAKPGTGAVKKNQAAIPAQRPAMDFFAAQKARQESKESKAPARTPAPKGIPAPGGLAPVVPPDANPPLPFEGSALYARVADAYLRLQEAGFEDTLDFDQMVSLSGRFAEIKPLDKHPNGPCEVMIRRAFSPRPQP